MDVINLLYEHKNLYKVNLKAWKRGKQVAITHIPFIPFCVCISTRTGANSDSLSLCFAFLVPKEWPTMCFCVGGVCLFVQQQVR